MDAIIEAAGKLVVLIGMGFVIVGTITLATIVYSWLRVMLIRSAMDVARAEAEAKATDLDKVVR